MRSECRNRAIWRVHGNCDGADGRKRGGYSRACGGIEDCGYTSDYVMFSNQLGVIFGLPEFPVMACVDVVSGIKTGTIITDAAPLKAVPRIKVLVLFINGAADTLRLL